ncbi:MAG: ATP-binding protein [Candidatus Omnitrophota bacterium]
MFTVTEKIELKGTIKGIYKTMGRAIADYGMVCSGDRVLVGVSGGVDSLSLLQLFKMRQERIPIDFEIVACLVNTNFIKVNQEALADYCRALEIDFVVKELSLDADEVNCFWCSWNRRKILFEVARDLRCNKVALGHNLDDIVETTLLNLFFLGEISSMKPKVELFEGKVTIIRPLCYLEKTKIKDFASRFSFPVTQYECAYGKDSRRAAMRELIGRLESEYPFVKKNIFGALGRVKKDYLL